MVERISAILKKNEKILNSKDECGIVFYENKNLILHQVSAWPDSLVSVGEKVSSELNLEMYPQPCKAVQSTDVAMLRIEPLKWWILGSTINTMPIEKGSTLDISHSRTHLKITGDKTKIFLNRFLPIDFREHSFPVNTVASTTFHHVGVTIWRSKNYYEIFIPRAFASSLWELMLESASQFGYEIK